MLGDRSVQKPSVERCFLLISSRLDLRQVIVVGPRRGCSAHALQLFMSVWHYQNISLSIQLLLLILLIRAHSGVETDILKSIC
jgi:hypothetical protein